MGIVQQIKLESKPEPVKSLIKAEILTENEQLTSAGREILEMVLIEEFADELKKHADVIIKAKKDQK